MASAAGVIQFNEPEVAWEGKVSARGPPPPGPARPAPSGSRWKPQLRPPSPAASCPGRRGVGFPEAPLHAPRLSPQLLRASSPPRWWAPKTGVTTPSPAAGNAKPGLEREHLPEGRAGPCSLRAGRERPGRGHLSAKETRSLLRPAGTEGGEAGGEEGTEGVGSAQRPGERVLQHPRASGQPRDSRSTAARGTGNRLPPSPWSRPRPRGSRGAEGLGAPPSLPASRPSVSNVGFTGPRAPRRAWAASSLQTGGGDTKRVGGEGEGNEGGGGGLRGQLRPLLPLPGVGRQDADRRGRPERWGLQPVDPRRLPAAVVRR